MSDLQFPIPEAICDLLVRDRAALAALLDHIAECTKDGRIARCAGIARGKRAGRRVIDDAVLLANVQQLIADGDAPGAAIKKVAAVAGGHSYAATHARLRRKFTRQIILNRGEH
jgi:hypothetical protein